MCREIRDLSTSPCNGGRSSTTSKREKGQYVPYRLTTAAAMTALMAIASSAQSASNGPQVSDFILPNGLELVVIPDHRAPVVTHMIWYKVGAAYETPGKSGLAHFL